MGAMSAKTYGIIKCIMCGNNSMFVTMCGTEYDPTVIGEYRLYFERHYSCRNCQAQINIRTLENIPDIYELLRKDDKWAESLKSEKNN